jgi:hypothetical protein
MLIGISKLTGIFLIETVCLYCDATWTNRPTTELLFGDNGLRGTPGALAFMRIPRRAALA